MENIEIKLRRIISQNLDDKISIDDISTDTTFREIGITSVYFIKIVVGIETEFDIEFDDEDLNTTNFPTIDSLISYIEKKLKSNEAMHTS